VIATIDNTPIAQPSTFSAPTKLSQALQLHKTTRTIKPTYHPPWKLVRVISGHLGWVRSVAVEPGNKWFATGAGDRVIKIWDLASGELKLSLTGHISTVRGLAVSPRHPYLFSCGEDKVCLISALPPFLQCLTGGLTDGQMLGLGSEQSYTALPRASLWRLFSLTSPNAGCARDRRAGRLRASMGHAHQSPNTCALWTHGHSGGREMPRVRSTSRHWQYGLHSEVRLDLVTPLHLTRTMHLSGITMQIVGSGCGEDNDDPDTPQKVSPGTCYPPNRVFLRVRLGWGEQHQKVEVPRRHLCI
jgi:hypothetical protein